MKRLPAHCLSLVFMFIICPDIQALPIDRGFEVRSLGYADGLSSQRVFSIVEDADKAMWFATKTGIDRYNGSGIRNYSLPGNYYLGDMAGVKTNLFYSPEKILYAYDHTGRVYRYSRENDSFIREIFLGEWIPGEIILNRFLTDDSGRLWFGLGKGLYMKNGAEAPVAVISGEYVNDIAIAGNVMYVGTMAGVFRLSMDSMEPEMMTDGLNVQTLWYDSRKNELWAGTFGRGLFVCSPGVSEFQNIRAADAASTNPVRAIAPYGDNNVIVGIDGGGVWAVDRNTREMELLMSSNDSSPLPLKGNGVYAVVPDTEGNVWVGSYTGGVSVLVMSNSPAISLKHEKNNPMSLADNNINDIEENSDGSLWFATDLGISVRNPHSDSWRHYLKGKVAVTLCRSGNGPVWTGTYGDGIYLLAGDGRELRHLSVENGSLTTNYIFSIKKDRYGEVWAGGLDGELMRFDRNGRRLGTYDIRWVHSIEFPDSATIAAATVNGFCIIDRQSGAIVRYATVDEFRDRNLSAYIVAMYFNGDGTVWLGTEGGGINHYDMATRQVKSLTMADGLPSNDVYSICRDASGCLYLATGKGLAAVSGDKVTSLNWMAGIEKEYNKSSFAALEDGRMVFGSTDGAVILPPDYVREENYQAELRFTGLKEDNISLSYKDNSFSVSYESVNYRWQSDIAYRHILEGYDRDWSERTQAGTLRYTNVPPGSYTLKVRNERIGNGETIMEISLPVHVSQPWWNTPLAWIVYCTLSFYMMFLIWRFKKSRLVRRHVEDKIRFFIDTAHDIRTPVTLIKAPLEDIVRAGGVSDTARRYLDLAMQNTEKLNALVGDLLDFEKIDADKSFVELNPLCLNDIVSETVAPFFPLCDRKGLHLDVLMPEEDVFVKADRHLMEMLLDNLLSNACKYTPEGGYVTVSLENTGRKAVISVKDTGIGVPKKARKYLFNNIFRAENARNSKEDGSGFGLIQVQRIVKILRGSVKCRSEENRGSVFTVILKRIACPAGTPEAVAVSRPAKTDIPKAFPEISGGAVPDNDADTLLIVEDHDDLRNYLSMVFADSYNVVKAKDGEEALEYLESGYPDLIISDVMMPGIQGDELCRRVKENPETSGIPFILLTAKTNHDAVTAGLRQGADDYIPKPFSPEILKLKVEGMIENRNRQRAYHMRMALEQFSGNATKEDVHAAGEEQMSDNDRNFVMKATELVLENISDPEFGIDELCRMLAMSRTLFFNRLKSLTGNGPQEFIRILRLRRAAELLKTGLNVNEAAADAGFVNVKYFTSLFKKQFGMPPSRYRQDGKS